MLIAAKIVRNEEYVPMDSLSKTLSEIVKVDPLVAVNMFSPLPPSAVKAMKAPMESTAASQPVIDTCELEERTRSVT